jgi:hypothetical protein
VVLAGSGLYRGRLGVARGSLGCSCRYPQTVTVQWREHQNSRTAEQQKSRTAEQQNSWRTKLYRSTQKPAAARWQHLHSTRCLQYQ